MFEFLVLAKDRSGKIVGCKESPAIWGKKEKPPMFELVKYECTKRIADYISVNCRWDFDTNQFVHLPQKENRLSAWVQEELNAVPENTPFTKEHAKTLEQIPDLHDAMVDKTEAEKVGDQSVRDYQEGMAYLWPKHRIPVNCDDVGGILSVRKFWLKLFWPERANPAVRRLMDAIKQHGRLGVMRREAAKLPNEVWQRLLVKLPEKDRKWLKDTWGINLGDSRDNRL